MPNTTQGMNWLRQDKRLALYLRDGLACVWCGLSVEEGAQLTADHVVPRSCGGGNAESNIVTACHLCNSRRGNRSVEEFAEAAALFCNHGLTAGAILASLADLTSRDLAPYRKEARAMIQRRGSVAKALAA